MTLELFQQDPYLQECEARVVSVEDEGIILDRTVFYPAGGGQPGDTGVLKVAGGKDVAVTDTRRGGGTGAVLHIPAPGAVLPAVGQSVQAVLDWERRYRLMRMHSCLHLLCAVVPAAVTGGQIHDGRGRLDFDLQDTLDREQLTEELNRVIARDRPRSYEWISGEQLDEQPELIRTMSVQPPRNAGRVRLVRFEGLDLQPCGGTHVARTGEIGAVRVAKIEKKGRHNRRITVVFEQQDG